MGSSSLPKARVDLLAGGVFLIGLGVLLLTGYWWPGILFVIGATSLVRGLAEGQAWYSVQGALWMIGLGVVFALGFSLPLLLILIGLSMLLGYVFRPPMFQETAAQPRRKREEWAFEEEEGGEAPDEG